ncbi:MAG TPA: hypothetical protein VLZ89_07020, partial [Anaerolineales bacterium]|nr:hypothetical protein [Anaerolineales bacterium]
MNRTYGLLFYNTLCGFDGPAWLAPFSSCYNRPSRFNTFMAPDSIIVEQLTKTYQVSEREG